MKSRPKNHGAIVIAIFLFLLTVQAQSEGLFVADDSWKLYKAGLASFESREFSAALTNFQNAIFARHQWYDTRKKALDEAYAHPSVKKSDPSGLDFSLKTMIDKNFTFAASIVQEALLVMPDKPRTLDAFLVAFAKFRDYPEAEFMIGKVYAVEGENALAEAQYLKALSLADSLEAHDDQYLYRYELAELYRLKSEYKKMITQYEAVLKDDPIISDPSQSFRQAAMLRILDTQGWQKVLFMYRIDYDFSMIAHLRLSYFYARTGNSDEASLHGMLGLCMFYTKAIRGFTKKDPDYEFIDIKGLVAQFNALAPYAREQREYAASVDLYRYMYYFGNALYERTSWLAAREVWGMIAQMPESGTWAEKAKQQLVKPVIEKPITNP